MGNLHGVAGPADRRLSLHAAGTSFGLSVLFLTVYGATNWLTTLRPEVPAWYHPWELAIPFVPLLIVPYMSIDLLFVAAPFLCATRAERTLLGRRITFAILVAAGMFLLMPLRLAYERVPVDGVLGLVFDTFRSMDAPHNLFPSLHITLRILLAETYARHTRGVVKLACAVWFSLIGFSTVLTYQHHLIDIAGAVVLAAFAFYLFRAPAPRLAVTPSFRIGGYYAAGAAVLLALACPLRPWGAFLLWPAAALAAVAAGYFGSGPAIFRKAGGRLPLSARVALAPILLGQYLSLLYYRRECHAWDEAAPGVWIGRQLTDREAAAAVRLGVTAVLDLTGEFSEARPFLGCHYLTLPILDLTAPTPAQLADAVDFITSQADSGIVYVHCKAGYSRSAAVVAAYLLANGHAESTGDAVKRLREARPGIILRDEALAAIGGWAERLRLPALT